MKIPKVHTPIFCRLKRSVKLLLGSVLISSSLNCCKNDEFIKVIEREAPSIIKKVELRLEKKLADSLTIVEQVNARGGKTKCYNDSSLEVLKAKMLKSGFKNTYVFPIDSGINAYIPSTGQFGSPRPAGRPHLGIDIYPVLYGRKPKKPVAVMSAIDGIVISVKESPKKDPQNLIANNIKIMGTDGKVYNYDHLSRPEDYPNSKYFKLKELGSVVHSGDTIGTVGRTGETAVWHLHMGVNDLDSKQSQLKSDIWQKLFKKHSVYANPIGQVDPLDSTKAGNISEILNKYKIDKGEKVDYVKNL